MTAACLVCGASKWRRVRHYIVRPDMKASPFVGAGVWRCAACGTAQMQPVPTEVVLADYYATAYRGDGSFGARNVNPDSFPKDDLWLFHRGLSVADFFRNHVQMPPPGRVLDYGAGYGHILHFLGDVFPKAERWALELDEHCMVHLKRRPFHVISPGTGDLLSAVRMCFDLIICSHVVEHFADPVGRLRAIGEKLCDDGRLYVEVPNCSLKWLRRNRWYDEPHITFFDVASARGLAERAGFQVMFLDTVGPELVIESRPPLKLERVRRITPLWLKKLLRGLKPEVPHEEVSRNAGNPGDSEAIAFGEFARYGGDRFWIRMLLRKK